jgi:diacylglycerol kinase family enzyme
VRELIPTIVNLNPGMNREVPDVRAVAAILGEEGEVIPTPSLGALEHAAKLLAEIGPERIAIWGGDGTLGATLTALIRAYGRRPLPDLCLLPGGTMNCIARCIGANGTAGSMLARLRLALEDGREIFSVRRSTLNLAGHYGFLFGVGLIPNFLSVYDAGLDQGPMRAFQVFMMAAPGLFRSKHAPDPFFDPFGARLHLDGQVWEGLWTNLSGGTVPCLPLGFRAYTRATERLGAFHFVAHDLRAWGAAYELAAIKLGFGMQRVKQEVTSRVLVELDRKLPFNLDGDNFDPVDRFELSTGPTITALLP